MRAMAMLVLMSMMPTMARVMMIAVMLVRPRHELGNSWLGVYT